MRQCKRGENPLTCSTPEDLLLLEVIYTIILEQEIIGVVINFIKKYKIVENTMMMRSIRMKHLQLVSQSMVELGQYRTAQYKLVGKKDHAGRGRRI